MKPIVIYWSSTGNTQRMAEAVARGAAAELYYVSDFFGDISEYEKIALGCPAMGSESLEDGEFEPFFSTIEDKLEGKKIALFGSYGWGDGEWMRNWAERVISSGAELINNEGFAVYEAPTEADLELCEELGRKLKE